MNYNTIFFQNHKIINLTLLGQLFSLPENFSIYKIQKVSLLFCRTHATPSETIADDPSRTTNESETSLLSMVKNKGHKKFSSKSISFL